LKKFLAGFMMFGCLALVLMIPAFAETTDSKPNNDVTPFSGTPGINKTYNRMNVTNGVTPNGTTSNGYYYDRLNGTRTGTGNGTGTFGMYGANRNGNTYGAYDSTRMNTYRPYSTNLTTRANNTVRAMETTTRRGFDWGWLGLLGLFGLAGMRSRSRDEVR
jgi:hypothetical protein